MRNSLQFVANSALFSAFAFMKTQKNQKLFNTRHSIANKIWEILPQAPKIKLLKCNLSDIQLGSNGQTILNMQPHQNKSCLGVLLVVKEAKKLWGGNWKIFELSICLFIQAGIFSFIYLGLMHFHLWSQIKQCAEEILCNRSEFSC